MAGVQNCEHCSAPLTLGAPGSVARCAYCGAENRIAGMTEVMPAAPRAPYGAPPSPYGAPPSPYGPGPQASGFGPPGSVRHAPPVRVRPHSNIAALLVLFAVFVVMGCGFLFFSGAALWGGLR